MCVCVWCGRGPLRALSSFPMQTSSDATCCCSGSVTYMGFVSQLTSWTNKSPCGNLVSWTIAKRFHLPIRPEDGQVTLPFELFLYASLIYTYMMFELTLICIVKQRNYTVNIYTLCFVYFRKFFIGVWMTPDVRGAFIYFFTFFF